MIEFLVKLLMITVLIIALLIVITASMFILRITIYWWLQVDYVDAIKNAKAKRKEKHDRTR